MGTMQVPLQVTATPPSEPAIIRFFKPNPACVCGEPPVAVKIILDHSNRMFVAMVCSACAAKDMEAAGNIGYQALDNALVHPALIELARQTPEAPAGG